MVAASHWRNFGPKTSRVETLSSCVAALRSLRSQDCGGATTRAHKPWCCPRSTFVRSGPDGERRPLHTLLQSKEVKRLGSLGVLVARIDNRAAISPGHQPYMRLTTQESSQRVRLVHFGIIERPKHERGAECSPEGSCSRSEFGLGCQFWRKLLPRVRLSQQLTYGEKNRADVKRKGLRARKKRAQGRS